ncbi:peptide chain release factor H [Aquimarina sp. AD10]|uniref:peptide chain release factor H n=1 Tax=Aquimarina sp. AD10 TaxID=1714849 RepID=UPI000E4DFCA4|nr:peptide chain release factor H [Aquimarina sp. AD10]AXT61414.1 peptide chain release factor H [Aquimarina sp. AD10]RKN01392.1 peptide chain release factor H [Aquimarina sp. AD10]
MKTKTIQITSGRGPVECCWVVAQVLKYFIEDIKVARIKYTLLHREVGAENGTLQSATIQLEGNGLEPFLKDWLGTIQWIGKSSFRKFNKRKNWFIGIYEIEETEKMLLKENEIKFQAIRSSGAGGQHVNKVSSAIRAIHTKTGIQVLVMDSRSQHQNKKIALKRLQEKVDTYNNEQLKILVQHQWGNHLNLERGNPTRVFTGSDFKKQKINKSYKSKRQESRNNLRQEKWD